MAVVAAALVGGTAWLVGSGSSAGEPSAVTSESRPTPASRDGRRDPAAMAREERRRHGAEADPAGVAPVPYGDGTIDRVAAEAGFEAAMEEVAAVAASRRRIEPERFDQLYRQANDAFAALSAHLDPHEPGDLDTLERAHRRLTRGLRRVRVRDQNSVAAG